MTSSALPGNRCYPFGSPAGTARGDGSTGHFLVTSSGHSGSIWLAGSLNLHEEVLANVGLGHPLQSFHRYALNKDVGYMVERASAEFIAYGFHTPTAHLPSIAGADTAPPRDLWRLPWFVFDELALVPAPRPYGCLGNVHGLILAHVFPAWKSDPLLFNRREVVLVDLIRHPIPRTESAIRATLTYHMPDQEPAISAFIHANAGECLELERTHHIDFSEPRTRAALIVYRLSAQNDAWAAEMLDYPSVHRVQMERLQAEPEYYESLFDIVTEGRLSADTNYLERVFAAANLGSGRQTTAEIARPPGAQEQYDLWSPFERQQFALATQRLDFARLYGPFGYDFSFVV